VNFIVVDVVACNWELPDSTFAGRMSFFAILTDMPISAIVGVTHSGFVISKAETGCNLGSGGTTIP